MSRSAPAPVRATLLALVSFLTACAPPRPAPIAGPSPPFRTEPELLGEPDVPDEVHVVRRDLLGGVVYDLPVEANSWVEAELDFLVGQRREVIRRWIERGDFYAPFIKEVLRSHGLPTDLYHLAMIESGFVPTAKSRVGAMGLWQFMPATGRQMGLRVDSVVDERMDPVRSTRAAARHLRSLHHSLRDWGLATAAYNAGSGRITRGLNNFQVKDFWSLAEKGDLAAETKHYVPRLYAVTVITRGRERFGFAPPRESATFSYDSVRVEYATPVEELARMGGATVAELSALNPHLLRGTTPAGGYWVWVPTGQGASMQRAYLASDSRKGHGQREKREAPAPNVAKASGSSTGSMHEVKLGDTLSGIAALHGVSVAALQKENDLAGSTIHAGRTLRIPAAADKLPSPRSRAENAEHLVQNGDTHWGIARKYGISVTALQDANGLGARAIQPGQKLTVVSEPSATP